MINLFIILILLINSLIFYFFCDNLKKNKISMINTFWSLFCITLSFMNYFYLVLLNGKNYELKLFSFMEEMVSGGSMTLISDSISSTMLLVMMMVSFMVMKYSEDYMGNDPLNCKFISFLYTFSFFMVFLVTSSNLVSFFMGWEGVGMCSFLLITFWGSSMNSVNSGTKAVGINKIGDFFFMMVMVFCFQSIKSMDFNLINCFFSKEENICNFLVMSSMVCVCSKSAQFGLHSWLPDAMEGPTPMSALIHAATMVTAGVFFLISLNGMFMGGKYMILILSLGALTCSLFSICGFFQSDLKKVMAYSTCSQLGFMVMTFYLGQYALSLFHLFNHAFFKAMLFLSAGSIIHMVNDEQDCSKFSSFNVAAPMTCSFINIGSLSLMGVFFLSGFYSKDLIMEKMESDSFFLLFYILVIVSCIFTCMYSLSLMYSSIFNFNNGPKSQIKMYKESNLKLLSPLFLLYILSMVGGNFFLNKFYNYEHPLMEDNSKDIIFFSVFLGAFFPLLLSYLLKKTSLFYLFEMFWYKLFPVSTYMNSIGIFKNFFFNKINMDKLFLYYFYKKMAFMAESNYYSLESQILEMFGPHGLYKMNLLLIKKINKMQPKYINDMFMVFLVSLFMILLSI